MTDSRGIMMFAHNNTEVDYFRLAVINSFLVQKHLGLTPSQVTIVTDSHSLDYAEKTLGKAVVKKASKSIILIEKDIDFKYKNIRLYKDTSHVSKQLTFYNKDRCDAYDISPYDETILIDCDYLVLSDSLNQCWGHNNDLMMNHQFVDAFSDRKMQGLDRIATMGINMYWATVIYFRKTPFAESFFNIVQHVRENREYYQDLYKWHGGLYRNDYSFSVAAHMMGGFQDCRIPQLPVRLHKTFDTDDIHSVCADNELIFYLEKERSPGDFILARWKGVDVHVMNKWAIDRIGNQMLELLSKNKTTHTVKKVTKKKVVKKKTTKKAATKGQR